MQAFFVEGQGNRLFPTRFPIHHGCTNRWSPGRHGE